MCGGFTSIYEVRYGSIFRHPTHVAPRRNILNRNCLRKGRVALSQCRRVCLVHLPLLAADERKGMRPRRLCNALKGNIRAGGTRGQHQTSTHLAADTRSAAKTQPCRPQLVSGRPYLLSGLFRVSRWGRAVAASSGVPPPHCTFPPEGL